MKTATGGTVATTVIVVEGDLSTSVTTVVTVFVSAAVIAVALRASVAIENRAQVEKRMLVVDLSCCCRFWQGMFLGIEYLWGSAAREETLWGC